jgi:inner membrane transporter RhtA
MDTDMRPSLSVSVAILLLLIAMVSIQLGASLAKSLFPLLGVERTTALRLTIAALILCVIWRPWKHDFWKKNLSIVIFYGVSLGVMNYLFYLAIERIPLGIAVGLEFTGPLAVALLSSRRCIDFVWALLAAVGIVLVLPLSQTSSSLDPVGVLYAAGAGLFWALYIVFGKKASSALPAGVITTLGMIAGSLVMIPIAAWQRGMQPFNIEALPLVFMVALLSSAIPYSLEMSALKKLPAKNFGILMSLEPAIAALSGLIFLHEHLSTTQWLAIICIIMASAGTAASVER